MKAEKSSRYLEYTPNIQYPFGFYSGKSGWLHALQLAVEPGVCCQGCSGIPETLNFISNCCKESFIQQLSSYSISCLAETVASSLTSEMTSKIVTFGGI